MLAKVAQRLKFRLGRFGFVLQLWESFVNWSVANVLNGPFWFFYNFNLISFMICATKFLKTFPFLLWSFFQFFDVFFHGIGFLKYKRLLVRIFWHSSSFCFLKNLNFVNATTFLNLFCTILPGQDECSLLTKCRSFVSESYFRLLIFNYKSTPFPRSVKDIRLVNRLGYGSKTWANHTPSNCKPFTVNVNHIS